MEKEVKAIIFDLDGTLLDTIEDLAAAVNRVLALKGFPVHRTDAYRHFVGDGADMLIHRALPPQMRTPELEKECLALYQEDYGQNWQDRTRPYPGIDAMLEALTARKIRLAILSNKSHAMTVQCVTHFLGQWPFDIVLGQRPQVPLKPDPAGALEVAEYMGLPPSAFLFMGDTAIDMKTARAAGMFPVGVRWGFRSAAELAESGAGLLITTPLEVLTPLETHTKINR